MRFVFAWLVVAALLSALAAAEAKSAHLSTGAIVAFGALYAAILASGVSTSTALRALRTGRVVVGTLGPRWGVWRQALVPVALASSLAAGLAFVVDSSGRPAFSVLLSSSWAAVIVARLSVRVPSSVVPIQRTAWRWLVVEGALPAALVAGVVGVVVGVVRFGSVATVSPVALSRTLAGTCLCYLLLGLSGFTKAFHERKAGVVVVAQGPPPSLPGPVFVGLGIAAVVAVLGPWVLPSIPGPQVWMIKGAVGVVVGGTLSLLGALAGRRAAVPPAS